MYSEYIIVPFLKIRNVKKYYGFEENVSLNYEGIPHYIVLLVQRGGCEFHLHAQFYVSANIFHIQCLKLLQRV
jgi:hypothetical protein